MRKIYFSLLNILIVLTAFAQSSELKMNKICLSPPNPPIYKTASPNVDNTERSGNNYSIPFDTVRFNPVVGNNGFDIVICIDGATTLSEISQADNYIDSFVNTLKTVPHYNDRFQYINIYRIAKLSNEKGATLGFSGDTSVDNRYGSRFNAFGLERLLIPEKYDTLFADVSEFAPQCDLAMMLTFDKKYGGAGYSLFDGRKVASFTLEEESGYHLGDEIAIHELQHLMPFNGHGYIGDEYEDSLACLIYDSIPPSPNFTNDTINKRKWDHCMDLPNVDFYPSAGICKDNYKPSQVCGMQAVWVLPIFCPVCRESSTAWLDSIINPIYSFSPSPTNFTGTYNYTVSIDTPQTHFFRYDWWLDGNKIATNTKELNVDFDALSKASDHELKFTATDTDPFIYDTTLRRPWTLAWNILTRDTTVGLSDLENFSPITIFPNPAKEQVTIGNLQDIIEIIILDLHSKVLLKEIIPSNTNKQISTTSWAKGIYIIQLKSKTGRVTHKKLIIQ
jgi:hypothetical protein